MVTEELRSWGAESAVKPKRTPENVARLTQLAPACAAAATVQDTNDGGVLQETDIVYVAAVLPEGKI